MLRRRTVAPPLALVALTLCVAPAGAQDYTLERAATPYDDLVGQANAAREAGALDEAVVLLEGALALDPARPEALNNLGVLAMDQGDYHLAAQRFLALAFRVADMPADDARAATFHALAHDGLLESGGLLLDEGATAEAKDIFTTLVELYPESGDARHNLALAFYDLGWYEEMLDVANAMIAAEPLSDAGWAFLQDAWLARADEAIDDASYDEFNRRLDDVRERARSLPVRLEDVRVIDGAFTGTAIGGSAAPGAAVTLVVRLRGRGGVLAERHVSVAAPPAGDRMPFSVPVAPADHVTGWSYTIAQ